MEEGTRIGGTCDEIQFASGTACDDGEIGGFFIPWHWHFPKSGEFLDAGIALHPFDGGGWQETLEAGDFIGGGGDEKIGDKRIAQPGSHTGAEGMDHHGNAHRHGHSHSQCGDGDGISMQGSAEVLGGEADHPARPANKTDKEIYRRWHEQRKTGDQQGNGGEAEKFPSPVERAPGEPGGEEKRDSAPDAPVAGLMGKGIPSGCGAENEGGIAGGGFGCWTPCGEERGSEAHGKGQQNLGRGENRPLNGHQGIE